MPDKQITSLTLLLLLLPASAYATPQDSEFNGIGVVDNLGTNIDYNNDNRNPENGKLITSPSVQKNVDNVYLNNAQPKIIRANLDLDNIESFINNTSQNLENTKAIIEKRISDTRNNEQRLQSKSFASINRELNASINQNKTNLTNRINAKITNKRNQSTSSANNYANGKANWMNSSARAYADLKLKGKAMSAGWREVWSGHALSGSLRGSLQGASEMMITEIKDGGKWSSGALPLQFGKSYIKLHPNGVSWRWPMGASSNAAITGIYVR